MSHKSGRKSHTAALPEEKEKRTDTPVKEMKKKIAANAEKEKQTTDKTDKPVASPEKADKNTEKVAEKPQNDKSDNKKAQNADKVDKTTPTPEKNAPKPDKNAEKTDKSTEKDKVTEKSDKKTDKVPEKKLDKPVEKKNEAEKKEESKGDGKDKPEKPKQNGASNGDANGTVDTVSDPDSSEEDLLVIDDQDEVFPELTYDETSDADFEEGAPSRSFTRRSQVKVTKTPETPRPASVKEDDSKEKLLKMNDSLASDRKLRSSDSPKPESKKPAEVKKTQDSPKKDKTIDLTEDETEKNNEVEKTVSGSGLPKLVVDVEMENVDDLTEDETEKNEVEKTGSWLPQLVVDVEMKNVDETRAKTRVRVSPYSRPPTNKHDQTSSSMMANYTGNNTTMEMDLTETSILEESNLDDSYLRGLKAIKGRSSYKLLKELDPKHTMNRSTRSTASTSSPLLNELRPTGTVVGRKRKTDVDHIEDIEVGREAEEGEEEELLHAHNKRMRLFERFSGPFRGFSSHRAAEIVGINTDLPLTAPVASTSSYDPETLKPSQMDPIVVPLPAPAHDRDGKRCLIM